MDPDRRVLELARHQLAMFTTEQAEESGLTERQVEHRLSVGRWEIWRPGVYGIAGVPPSWERSVLAAVLAAGPDAVASHTTAGVLWGAWGLVADSVELTTTVGHRVQLAGVKSHRTRHLLPSDRTRHKSVPVTSVARTVVDLAGSVTPYLLDRIVDGVIDRGLTTLAELSASIDRLGGRGRRGAGELARVLAERAGTEACDSALERRILGAIRSAGLPEPVPQYQVVVGRRLFVLDFAYPDLKVDVEGDGFAVHGRRTAFDGDRERDNVLENAGWLIRRFTSRSSDLTIARTVAGVLELRNCGESTPLLRG
jgi:very-short-patch-repair endonuclease